MYYLWVRIRPYLVWTGPRSRALGAVSDHMDVQKSYSATLRYFNGDYRVTLDGKGDLG